MKTGHELGSERCETVRSLSRASVGILNLSILSTRGAVMEAPLVYLFSSHRNCRVATCEVDKR